MLVKAAIDALLSRFMRRYLAEDFESRLRSLVRVPGEFGVDPFGLDPEFIRYVAPIVWLLHRIYFRVQSSGLEHIPKKRVLLVGNHSGQLPIDGLLIATTMMLELDPPRMLRSMVEKWVPTLPYVSTFMARCGQVVGLPQNCRTLLEQEEAILVFPEGVRGISKTWNKRYELQPFGQGFMRLALQNRTPILPVAVIGAEEQAPSLYNFKPLARMLGAPAFPITPTFPWLFPVGLLPYPVKYRIHFGRPLVFEGDPIDDDEVIEEKIEVVRAALKRLISKGLKERSHVFW